MPAYKFVLMFCVTYQLALPPLAAWGEDHPNGKYVIIHSDDAGMCHSVNLATIKAMEEGVVSSASIMVPCPWFSEMAAYAKVNPDKDFGIHFTLTSEWDHYRWGPVAPKDKVPSLIDKDGYLWDDSRLVAENVKAEEVEIELRAQIDRARQFGVNVTHLDSHMGALFSRADLARVYVKVGIEYNLPVLMVRIPKAFLERAYPALAPVAEELIAELEKHNFPILDALDTGNYGVPAEQKKDYYLKYLRGIKPGLTEILIHCGFDNAELQGATSSSSRRGADTDAFLDPEVIREIKTLDLKPVTWKKVFEHYQKKTEK
jgi:hypothetical protein